MAEDTHRRVQQLINEVYNGNYIDEMTRKWLCGTPNPPRIPILYTLTKIHKPTPVGRPIISGCDGPTEKFAFIVKLLQPINWPASSIWVFIAQLGEHCSANAEATGSNPVEPLPPPPQKKKKKKNNFFSGYFRNCLNCDSLRWSYTHSICIPAVHIISYKNNSVYQRQLTFSNFLEKTKVPNNTILVSMDVTSLYTNIPQEEGIDTVCRAYETFHKNEPVSTRLLEKDTSYKRIHFSSMEITTFKHTEPQWALKWRSPLPIFLWQRLKLKSSAKVCTGLSLSSAS